MIDILHTADLHFSTKTEKLEEVITTTGCLLAYAGEHPPNLAIIAGDSLDEADTPIRIDSEAARAAISFVTRLANICPVLIVRGTRSHDRESPYLFRHLRTTFPVYVADKFEQIAYCDERHPGNRTYFWPLGDALANDDAQILAAFTLLPSPDKSGLVSAVGGDSLADTNRIAKESLNDLLAFFGENVKGLDCPHIAVGHGMITGAQFSGGMTAVGEDLEYSLSDLKLLNADLQCWGHIHKMQNWGDVFYSGSPGRLNMGETEVKGFLIHTLDGRKLVESHFIETPARRFVLVEAAWSDGGLDGIMAKATECEAQCAGADVRFRYDIPDECRHQVNRDELRVRFEAAGARLVKIEQTILPTVRVRAQGISQLETLADKIRKWSDVTGVTVPERVYEIAKTIEGRDTEELIDDAKRQVEAQPLPTFHTEPEDEQYILREEAA
jgi:DNA repair exonuclease SbcCD nuclease subunit